MIHYTYSSRSFIVGFIGVAIFLAGLLVTPNVASAATLSLWPDSGVHTVGETINVQVRLNTMGQTINAADGRIRVSGSGVSIVGVSQSGSIFSLWAEEPRVSGNDITFSGGIPAGYQGSSGNIMTITLRATAAGTPRLSFQDGSVLAADGRGSNILTSMNGGTYTIRAQETTPAPERVEYVPAVNTPAAPVIRSETHPEPDGWSDRSRAELSWSIPSGVTSVRTALTQNPSSVPNQVADSLLNSFTTDELPDGVSYFHVQFRNADGWGSIGRYRLGVDTRAPKELVVQRIADIETYRPEQQLSISASSTSPLSHALIKIDDAEPDLYELSGATTTIDLPPMEPGYRVLVVEVFDAAGNSTVTSLSLTIDSFAAPTLGTLPENFTAGTIPVFTGTTTPRAEVIAVIRSVANDTKEEFRTTSNEQGVFNIIPDRPLRAGIYELTVSATDEVGARSDSAGPIRFVVQEPGYVLVGSWLISVLSIVVPTLALIIILVLSVWYSLYRWRRLRSRVARESLEAHNILREEFTALRDLLEEEKEALIESRKSGKLTKAENHLVATLEGQLDEAEQRVTKEVADIEALVPDSDPESSRSS